MNGKLTGIELTKLDNKSVGC